MFRLKRNRRANGPDFGANLRPPGSSTPEL